MIEVRVITGLPGSGKTEFIIEQMATTRGRYIFATSRIALIKERVKRLRHFAKLAGTSPLIKEVHSQTVAHGYRKIPVSQEIADLPDSHGHHDHVVVFISHEGMMAADFAKFAGWHVIIDENPAAIASSTFTVPATSTYLEQAYELEPLADTKWWRVRPIPGAPSLSHLINDDFLKDLATFDKRSRTSQGVYVDIDNWGKAKGSSKPVRWWSAWTPLELEATKSITVAGAGYYESLGYKATQAWFSDSVVFEEEKIVSTKRARPLVRIRYFARHKGSTWYWQDKGRESVLKVADALAGVPNIGYWAANKVIAPYFAGRVSGLEVSPRQEGTNSLRHHTVCAMIYSAKATPKDSPLLEAFGLARDDVQRARETEDIIQFAMRGRLRDAQFGGTYTSYVYSLDQAEALRDYLVREGIGRVVLEPINDAGIMSVKRPAPGRPKQRLSQSSQAQKAKVRREADRLRKAGKRAADREMQEREGTRKPRGRPKLHALTPEAHKARHGFKRDLRSTRGTDK